MRTKHLLTAIALPMLFAACTADELGTMDSTVKDDLSKRPVVEGVKIAFNDANTRASQGANFNTIKFEEGDKVGALLVDQLTSAKEKDPIKRYTLLQTNFNTNYVFETKDGASFSAEAYLTEGNYVFYYPFNGQRTRNQILTDLPTEQALTKGADGVYTSFPSVLSYSEENGSPLAIAYDFISSTDAEKTVQSTMKQIYAVPLITINNGYAEPDANNKPVQKAIKIKQIVLTKGEPNENKVFTVKAPLKFAAAAQTAYVEATNSTSGAQYSSNKSIVSALFNEAIPANTNVKKGFWLNNKTSVNDEKATSDILDAAIDGGTSSEIVLTLETPVEVAAEGSFSFYAVIPAEDYTTDVLKMTVINDKGLGSSPIVLGTATLQPSKRYPAEEYDNDGLSLSAAKGEALTGTVEGFDDRGALVSTVDELISAIKNAPAPTEDNPAYEIRLSGTAVINSRVAGYLKSTSTKAKKINIVNAATIEGTFTLEPKASITEFCFEKGVTVKEGANVTFNSTTETPNIKIAEGNDLNIATGATLTYSSATLTDVTVKNAGTLKLANSISAKAINNTGTVSVEGKKGVDEVTVTTAAVTEDDKIGNFTNGSAAKAAAILNIAKGKTLKLATGALVNMEKATINNEGILTAETLLTNESGATINNGSGENLDAKISSAGEKTQESEGSLTFDVTIGTVNFGTISNYGDAKIYANAGTIDMKTVNAKVEVTSEYKYKKETSTGYEQGIARGSISNDVLALVESATSLVNTVTYTMTGKQEEIPSVSGAGINTVVLNGVTMTLKDNAKNEPYDIVVEGTTSFSNKNGASSNVSFTLGSGKTLTVAKNAVLTVNAGVIFGENNNRMDIIPIGKVVNYGTIYSYNIKDNNNNNTTWWSGTGETNVTDRQSN